MKSTGSIRHTVFGLGLCVFAAFSQTPGAFTLTGNLTTGRAGHAAILLQDGRVLLAGGQHADGSQPNPALASAELYDPASSSFTPTGSMSVARIMPSATLLADGRVLVVGGTENGPAPAELYDPTSGTFTPTGAMTTGPAVAALLRNGKLLIAGNPPQIYDPVSDSVATTGSFVGPFYYGPSFFVETATLLQDGRVLVTGSADNSDGYLEHEELYDPITGTFKVTGTLHTFGLGSDLWATHTATLLPNGKVLLAGGVSEDFGTFSIAELYDPSTETFTRTANMTVPRAGHTATLLPDGTVLLAGGQLVGSLASAELYNPAAGTFSATGSMTTGRFWQGATLLLNATVLMSGGVGANGSALPNWLASAELYCPANTNCPPDPWQQAITLMKTSAGTDSCNYWQWAWFWQTLPVFNGAPAGFGVAGSISSDLMSKIIVAGGGDSGLNISAEQWVTYFRQVVQQ